MGFGGDAPAVSAGPGFSALIHKTRVHLADPLYRNGYLLFLNSITGAAFGFAFWFVAARVWSPAQVGAGAGAVSAMTLVALLGKLGLDAGVIRYVPPALREDRRRLVATGIAAAGALSLALALVALAGIPRVSGDLAGLREPAPAVIFALSAAAIAVAWVLDASFVAARRAELSLLRNVVFNAVKLALPFVAAVRAHSLGIPFAWGCGVAASVACAVAVLPRALGAASPVRNAPRAPGAGELLRYSSLTYVQNVSEFLPGLVLPLLVLSRLGSHANAVFYVAWTLAFMAVLASKSISQSTFAELALAPASARDLLRKAALQHALVLGSFCLFVVAFGRPLLGLLSPEYATEGYPILLLLTLPCAFVAVINVFTTCLKAVEANRELVLLPLAVLAVVLAVALLLLPIAGLAGVGIAWAVANGAGAVYAGVRLRSIVASIPRAAPPASAVP